MTDTLFDVALALGEILGGMKQGLATNGTTTTIVDTNLLTQQDNHWNGGAAFIMRDAGGSSAAPEAEFSPITDFTNSTGTVTLRDTLTGAVATGDDYALTPGKYPLHLLKAKINAVLSKILIPAEDTTSLDTASAQTEYTLPAACVGTNLRQVWWETNEDANDNQWQEIRNWYVKDGGTGTQDTLVIPQLTAERDIRLTYVVKHPRVYDADDEINENVHINRIIWEAASFIMIDELARNTGNKAIAQLANYYQGEARDMRTAHPVRVPPVNGKLFVAGIEADSDYTGEVGAVRLG